MNIFIPAKAKEQTRGGGWQFTANIIKALRGQINFVDRIEDADIFFITGPTLAEKSEVELAVGLGKKVVLRVDNMPRNSRNRNTCSSKLLKYAEVADAVIYQSQWAKDFLKPFLKKEGEVILNGVDTEIFRAAGEIIKKQGCPQCLYVRSSRDETKRWEKAWYNFQKLYFNNPQAHLWIVGKFNPENVEYNFDLFGGAEKRYTFLGVIESDKEMAKIYRSADILFIPFSNEACSNTFAEARACGLNVVYEDDGGGIVEQAKSGIINLEEMGKKYMDIFNKL